MGSGGNILKAVVDQVANVGVNFMTGGLAGYEDGQVGKGVVGRALDEGIGEITGRNTARDQLDFQKSQVAAAADALKKKQADELKRSQMQDLSASGMAGVNRMREASSALGGAGAKISADAQFLGV